MISRKVAPETLDGLAEDDPAARRSRRDLRRIHRAMGTRSLLLSRWRSLLPPGGRAGALRVLELGAGDGTLLLGVARSLAPGGAPVELTLLDRQDLLAPEVIAEYRKAGWIAVPEIADVEDWAAGSAVRPDAGGRRPWDLIVANLFLHHFEEPLLAGLLRAVASRTDRFLALEPRRSLLALAASHLVGAIGANAVTRRDSVLSVRAGFRGRELSALWPAQYGPWRLQERAAGPFSHAFTARRADAP